MNYAATKCFMLCRCRTGSTALIRAIDKHGRAVGFSEILNGSQEHCYQSYLVDLLREDKA